MAIIYPRELPTSMAMQGFRIQRHDLTSPENSGRIGGVQSGWPRWSAQWTVGTTEHDVSDAIEAWIASMRGSQKHFLGRDLRRPFPLAHIGGFRRMLTVAGQPFSGACSGWAQSTDADESTQITLFGVPAGLVLSPIDYVGFRWDAAGSAAGSRNRRALVQVMAGGVANAAGEITVIVEPSLPPWVPANAQAHLDRPACLMKLTGDTQVADVDRRLRIKGTRIVGVQVLVG